MRAQFSTGVAALQWAIDRYDEENEPSREVQLLAAQVFCGAAMILMEQNAFERAHVYVERARLLREQVGDEHGLAAVYSIAGRLAYAQEHYDDALTQLRCCLRIQRRLGDRHGIAVTLKHARTIAYYRGNHSKAGAYLRRSLALFEALGDATWVGYALINLANVHYRTGRHDIADALYLECLAIRWLLGARAGIDSCLAGLVLNAWAWGKVRRAAWIYGVERRLAQDMALRRPDQDERHYRGMLAQVRQVLGVDFEIVAARGEQTPVDEAIAILLLAQPPGAPATAGASTDTGRRADYAQFSARLRGELNAEPRRAVDQTADGCSPEEIARPAKGARGNVLERRRDLARYVRWRLECEYGQRMGLDRDCDDRPKVGSGLIAGRRGRPPKVK